MKWIQFRLRTAFVALTIFCAWLGILAEHSRRTAQAIATIERLGGKVYCFSDRSLKLFPEVLRSLLPKKACCVSLPPARGSWERVKDCDFPRIQQREHDEAMRQVSQLTDLQILFADNTDMSDEGLQCIRHLHNIRVLSIGGTGITDSGLAVLVPMRGLEAVALVGTDISDAAMPHLEQMRTLRVLNIRSTKISLAGLDRLHKALPHCEIVYTD